MCEVILQVHFVAIKVRIVGRGAERRLLGIGHMLYITPTRISSSEKLGGKKKLDGGVGCGYRERTGVRH
jgi:hypothetical protein